MTELINLTAAVTAFLTALITYSSFKLTDEQAQALMKTINSQIDSVKSANDNSAEALEGTQKLMERLIERLPSP